SAVQPADAAQIELDIAERVRALDYAQYGFGQLLDAYHALRSAGRGRDAQFVAAHAQDRFIGSPERETFLLGLAEESSDSNAYVAVLEQGLASQPDDWNAYYRLARAHLIARHPEQAQRTLLAFPPFRADNSNLPALVEQAHAGGELLLEAGEALLARSLFQLAAQYQTESPARLKSELRLAQLDGH